MAGENEIAATDAADDNDNDDDFNAGLNREHTPTETPADTLTPQPTPTPTPTPAPTEAPKFVQITEEEWNATKSRAAKVDEISATLGKRLDTAFGKVGGIERAFAELQAKTPSGESVQLDEADFKELAEEYPDLARMQLAGLNKALAKLKGNGGDPAAFDKKLEERVNEVRGEIVNASLEAVLPDWQDEVKTPQFDTWLKGQASNVQALAQSKKVGDAARMLRLYGIAKDTPAATPAPPPAPAATPAPSNTRARQIAAAVPPKGDGGHPPGPTEEDDFSAGLKYREKTG